MSSASKANDLGENYDSADNTVELFDTKNVFNTE